MTLATWGDRVAAVLLDALVLVSLVLGVAVLSSLAGALSAPLAAPVAAGGHLLVLAFLVGQHVVVQGRTGRTLGKARAGLRVVRAADGRPPGVRGALARWLAHLLDGLPLGLGWLWPLWDRRRQTFADKLCRTVVVRG